MTDVVMDRISPTTRPTTAVRGYQHWRDLLFLHWPARVSDVRRLVPKDLELDLWEGQALVGVVPFAMRNVRPSWAPALPGIRHFLETNVRLYVHHKGVPGVFFLSLDAANAPAVVAARVGWSLPYFYARMSLGKDSERVRYTSRRLVGPGAQLEVEYELGEELSTSVPDTLQHFLCERYVLFCERGGGLVSGRVFHTPYPLRSVGIRSLTQSMSDAAGLPVQGVPMSALYSPGVDVEVFDLLPVDAAQRSS